MGYYVDATSQFEKELRKLVKKYPRAVDRIEDLIESLENGKLIGEDIPGLKIPNNKVFKTRLENTDANKGKRGGFRMIYYLVTNDKEIYLLSIYSKSDKEDIPDSEVTRIIKTYSHDPFKSKSTN